MRYEHDHENDVIYFAQTNFRNQMRKFGIKTDDRRRHVYVIGKTGMGKTTLLENMILSDIYAGHGCCYIDPHGDTAEKLIDYIPSWRINDTVYFNPSDAQYPIGFNILEAVDETMKHLVTAGLMGVFKKIWEGVWSARMEYIMNNAIMALLDTPGTTLLGINRMLSDAEYRKRIVSNIKDPLVKQFWVQEFAQYQDKFATEAVAPIQNKVGQFTNNVMIRNIIAQAKSSMNFRDIMDNQKIFIVNLSKGRIGEDASRLLGGMMVTKLQMTAMERVDLPEEDRNDFYMYVDEFQNFAVESFASILSEARKYRLNLIMAHQYIAQLTEEVRDAVFGNVGTLITFRVGSPDAIFMESELMPRFLPEDMINLPKYQVYLKLMIDGVTSMPFSALTLPPIAHVTNSLDRVITQTRERYSGNRAEIEAHVAEWSGFGEGVDLEAKYKEIKEKKTSAKKERFAHEYECTRCGKSFKLPVELDRSRPIYCEECLPIIEEQRKNGKKPEGRGIRKNVGKEEKPKRVEEKPPSVRDGKMVTKESSASASLKELTGAVEPEKLKPALRKPEEPKEMKREEESERPRRLSQRPIATSKTEEDDYLLPAPRAGEVLKKNVADLPVMDAPLQKVMKQSPTSQSHESAEPRKRKRRRRSRGKKDGGNGGEEHSDGDTGSRDAAEAKSIGQTGSVRPNEIVNFD